MKLLLRRLNDAGVDLFRDYLHTLREQPTTKPPASLLDDPETSEDLAEEIRVNVPERFDTRYAFARWLFEGTDAKGRPLPRNDRGFWTWLSLALFDHVCPADSRGRRKPGADARHIPDTTDWRRRYRHLLANPYDVYYLHRDFPARAFVALVNPLQSPGELSEQFTV
jgi:hypothetical protein